MKVTLEIPDSSWWLIADAADELNLNDIDYATLLLLRAALIPRKGPVPDISDDVRILQLHAQKLNNTQIAREIKRPVQFVYRRLRSYGLYSNAVNNLGPEYREVVMRLKAGQTTVQIVEETKIPKRKVVRAIAIYRAKVDAAAISRSRKTASEMVSTAA